VDTRTGLPENVLIDNVTLQYDMGLPTRARRAHLDVYGDGDGADRDAGDVCGDTCPSVRSPTASSASRLSARANSLTTSGRSPYGVTL